MFLTVTVRDDNGEALGVVVLKPRQFATGSKGFGGTAKLEIGGKRHQASINVVEIGSKASEASPAEDGR